MIPIKLAYVYFIEASLEEDDDFAWFTDDWGAEAHCDAIKAQLFHRPPHYRNRVEVSRILVREESPLNKVLPFVLSDDRDPEFVQVEPTTPYDRIRQCVEDAIPKLLGRRKKKAKKPRREVDFVF